jgi:RNA polymerase sigma factor (sigma-70 family)
VTIGEGFDEVLEAARAGGEWAWEQLYNDLAPAVLGYLRQLRASDPQDMLGEVFVHVVRGIGGFSGDEAGFRSWVFVIAHHRSLDDRRRLSRHPVQPAPTEKLDAPAPHDVERDVLDRLATDRVTALFEHLTGDQRAVLLLRIVGGLTVEEVARAVGKRPGAVKALQRRGLAAVRALLERGDVPL